MSKLLADINKSKLSLISKSKKKGIRENFGQDEVRRLKEKYIDISAYSDTMNMARDFIQNFSNRCMNYTG